MRKRDHFIGLWLSEAEYRHLLKQCTLSSLNTSALLRHSIMGVNIQPRPPNTYADLLRELSAIGNNINQIACSVNQGIARSEDAKRGLCLLDQVYELMYQIARK